MGQSDFEAFSYPTFVVRISRSVIDSSEDLVIHAYSPIIALGFIARSQPGSVKHVVEIP
jgi:hypothetical protein